SPRSLVTDREIAHGDLVYLRAGALAAGWEGSITRTWVCGEPDAVRRSAFAGWRAAFDAGLASCVPGATIAAVRAAGGQTAPPSAARRAPARDAGMNEGAAAGAERVERFSSVSVDGVGMGHEDLADAELLEPGMVLALEACGGGIVSGETVVVRDEGAELLTTFPHWPLG